MSDIYTTTDTAKIIEVSVNTLRTWKNRTYKDRLIEGVHWVTKDSQVYWTEIGISELRLLEGDEPLPSSNDELPTDSTEDRYTPLIDEVARAITPSLLSRLDRAVLHAVKDGIKKPMSANECVTILSELGLKPANPDILLGSQKDTPLLRGNDNGTDD